MSALGEILAFCKVFTQEWLHRVNLHDVHIDTSKQSLSSYESHEAATWGVLLPTEQRKYQMSSFY
jgi:hypothetical protein